MTQNGTLFAEEDYDAFCLAYMFTYRDFEMGTLGLAWTGDLKNAGGVCEKNGVSLLQSHLFKPSSMCQESIKTWNLNWTNIYKPTLNSKPHDRTDGSREEGSIAWLNSQEWALARK